VKGKRCQKDQTTNAGFLKTKGIHAAAFQLVLFNREGRRDWPFREQCHNITFLLNPLRMWRVAQLLETRYDGQHLFTYLQCELATLGSRVRSRVEILKISRDYVDSSFAASNNVRHLLSPSIKNSFHCFALRVFHRDVLGIWWGKLVISQLHVLPRT